MIVAYLYTLNALLLLTCNAAPVPAPHSSYHLQYKPFISSAPVSSKFLRESTNKAGRLYSLISTSLNYSSPVQLLKLSGSPQEVGSAYGELLSNEIQNTYQAWYPEPSEQLEQLLDWLFNCSLKAHIPDSLLDELNGIQPTSLRTKVTRVMTGSTMPADKNNIQILVQRAIAAHGNVSSHCAKVGKEIFLDSKTSTSTSTKYNEGLTHHCDFFAAWGSKTEDGRLLSSRNLDIKPATGISKHKLITIYDLDSDDDVYATVGFAGYFGSLAGMNRHGITVSEANLDNSEVSFDGIPWPLRLRQILGTAETLDDARSIWSAQPNTAAFNFLISDGNSKKPSAVALETNSLHTSEFFGNSTVEKNATYSCVQGTVMDGHVCSWPNNNSELVSIGMPLVDAVFRSNHALSPEVMKTQEPLWNDTVMRYVLLHDQIQEVAGVMGVKEAVGIASLLGIKGENYGVCSSANFRTGDPTHVLSVVYDPSIANMYVAFEEGNVLKGENANWRPAACQEYLWLNLTEWW